MHPVITAQLAILAHCQNEPQHYSSLYYGWLVKRNKLIAIREEMAGNWSRFQEVL